MTMIINQLLSSSHIFMFKTKFSYIIHHLIDNGDLTITNNKWNKNKGSKEKTGINVIVQ